MNLFLRGRDSRFEEPLQTLRSAERTVLYYPVYEFAEAAAAAPVLQARMYITEEILADFALGRVRGLVVLEELHTAAEQIMRELLDKTDKQSLSRASAALSQQHEGTVKSNLKKLHWPELRGMCQELGHFPDAKHFASLTQDRSAGIDHSHTPNDALAELNRLRNAAKHKGSPDQPWLDDHWECISAILEHMAGELV